MGSIRSCDKLRSLGSTAGCGKPHVRWCGRGDGRNPVTPSRSRLRPVLMTAFAMIVGMLPMAIGWGEGAEQNAPLGRAVIGGLVFATVSTLLFVPLVFAGSHRWLERRRAYHLVS